MVTSFMPSLPGIRKSESGASSTLTLTFSFLVGAGVAVRVNLAILLSSTAEPPLIAITGFGS